MTDVRLTSQFFTVGGTLSLEAPYVVRPTDEQLLRATLAQEYCNVLTPRQMGKSSLMVRTADRLRREGVHSAVIDLTDIGTELNAEEWYLGLVTRLTTQLGLGVDEHAWWEGRAQQGVVQRFSDFLRDVILEEIPEPVVVFVDEIDSTLGLPFTDDFFAAIRAAYNARASDPTYKRLTFVLLGVVRPADLIKDRSRTPYNIGLSIDLQDFTLSEACTLLPGLETTSPAQADAILRRVLYWTGGHPYLTQKVCAEIVATPNGPWADQRIDQLVRRLFVSDEARKESNLQFVRDQVQESRRREKLLRIYREVLSGKPVPDEERDPVKSQLKLTGLLKVTQGGALVVRNQIYATVFDRQWVKETSPLVTPTRVAIVATATAVIALALVAWLFFGRQNSDEIRAETYAQAFLDTQSSAVRLTNLTGLLQLGDLYAPRARDLFFSLEAEQQSAIFAELNTRAEVGNDLQTVIKGLYTHVQNDDPGNALLQAMTGALDRIALTFPDSRLLYSEIEAWRQGRAHYQDTRYGDAVRAYGQAIAYEDENPATFLDRALAYARLEQFDAALADLTRVVELDPERLPAVAELVQADSGLRDYLITHPDDFPALRTFVE